MTLSKFIYKLGHNRYEAAFKRFFRRRYWSWIVQNQCAEVGEELSVNFKSSVSSTTYLGNHVNFNGMIVAGGVLYE